MGTSKELQVWIEQMMSKKGIDKYTLDISGSSSKGDGYLGEITFVKISCELEKGRKKMYDIVVKSAKTNDDLRKNTPIIETYQREILMYTKVLPAIERFQKENAVENCFLNYPKCYSVCELPKQEALLLSNLKSLGYVIHERMYPQNFEHVKQVFRTYAIWHGSSLALKTKQPELFRELTKDMTDVMGDLLLKTKMIPVLQKYFEKSVSLLQLRGKEKAAKKILEHAGDVLTILTKMTIHYDKEAEKEAVILHGDCWNNNMMFKYKDDDTTKPVDMAFIDFQISRLASPILDLSYYLYAMGNQETLDNFDSLLVEYYITLSNYLKQYDIDCEDLLPLKRLQESWRKYGRYGLLLNPFITRVELCHEDEVIEFTEKMTNNTMEEINMDAIRNQNEYDRRVFSVFSHFAEKFL